jgi:hypothetical protein
MAALRRRIDNQGDLNQPLPQMFWCKNLQATLVQLAKDLRCIAVLNKTPRDLNTASLPVREVQAVSPEDPVVAALHSALQAGSRRSASPCWVCHKTGHQLAQCPVTKALAQNPASRAALLSILQTATPADHPSQAVAALLSDTSLAFGEGTPGFGGDSDQEPSAALGPDDEVDFANAAASPEPCGSDFQ